MEGLVTSPATISNGVAPTAFSTIDPSLVVEHLASVLEIALGASRKELENEHSLLSKSRYSETVQRCTRFATESQVALYVQKDIASGESLDGSSKATLRHLIEAVLNFQTSINFIQLQPSHGHFLLFINHLFHRPTETTAPYRSFNSHIFTITNY